MTGELSRGTVGWAELDPVRGRERTAGQIRVAHVSAVTQFLRGGRHVIPQVGTCWW